MNLITDISQVRAYSTINVSNTLEQWKPYLDEALETFIRPMVGSDLISELEQFDEESSSADALFVALLDKVRKPLALYGLVTGADEMAVSVSGSGIQVINTESHRPAPQYLIQNLKESWMRRAHVSMDALLLFLEANRDSFSSYASSYHEYFIPTAEEFQKYQDIRSSRRVFLSLLPVLRSIEQKYIRYTVSQAYFDELKESLQSGSSVSEDDSVVIGLIKPALAHLTMSRALQEISIDILDWGVFLNAVSTFDNVVIKQVANRDNIAMMVKACQQDGDAELKELQQFLDKNASPDRYKTYFDSERYVGADQDPVNRNVFVNKDTNSIFVF